MPRIERTAELVWEGNLARGSGTMSAGSSGAFRELPYTAATRMGQPEGKTSPEELLAAAHGGCFAMSLGAELGNAGVPADRIEVTCRIVMDEVAGEGHQIVSSQIVVRGVVPGADHDTFAAAVERADEGCPYSSLLKRARVEVAIDARLEES